MNRYQPRIPTALALGVCQKAMKESFVPESELWKQYSECFADVNFDLMPQGMELAHVKGR